MIYMCNNCGFLFERSGEISVCPCCDKENIRIADKDDKDRFSKLIEEEKSNILDKS